MPKRNFRPFRVICRNPAVGRGLFKPIHQLRLLSMGINFERIHCETSIMVWFFAKFFWLAVHLRQLYVCSLCLKSADLYGDWMIFLPENCGCDVSSSSSCGAITGFWLHKDFWVLCTKSTTNSVPVICCARWCFESHLGLIQWFWGLDCGHCTEEFSHGDFWSYRKR